MGLINQNSLSMSESQGVVTGGMKGWRGFRMGFLGSGSVVGDKRCEDVKEIRVRSV